MRENKKHIEVDKDQKQPIIVFLSVALALFLGFVGFFAWHTARMRSFELDYVKIEGTVVGVKERHGTTATHRGSRTSYYLVISYTFEGQEYTFTDRTGHRYIKQGVIGAPTEIYVNPDDPSLAEKVTSAGFVSIICACFFAFFCVTYASGMNVLLSVKGSSFKKRCLFVWGVEILLAIVFLLLCWLGLPNSGFGEVFLRIEGAVGLTVVSGLVLCAAFLDGIITYRLRKKMGYR